jgi:uncharacterized oligopeptide transporter (OPT) family protein
MWRGLNSGTLERQLDAQARAAGAAVPWRWPRVALGVVVGLCFALVNQYVGLRTGLIVFGSWYVVFLAGLALRWAPAEINIAAVASSGANFIVGGYAYVLPALFLAGGNVSPPLLAAAVAGTALAGILGSLAFAALRQAWIVEQPLPYPSFEQYVQLLALAQPQSLWRSRHARRTGLLVGGGALAAGAWTFARDVPLAGGQPLLAALERGGWYSGSAGLQQPLATAQLTWLNLALSPLLLAVGWFMRLRIALMVALGSAFAWLLAVPLAVLLDLPSAQGGLAALAAQGQPSALLAFAGPVRALAAGAIVGGGLTALLRLAPRLRGAVRQSLRLRAAPAEHGAYDWPPHHASAVGLALVALLTALLTLGGAPLLAALLLALLVVAGVVLLGAVAVKAAGETSLEPASAVGFLMAIALVLALQPFGLPVALVATLAIVGTAVFQAGVTMMGNLLLDVKIALYVGNRPHDVMRAALLGIVPGAVLGGAIALLLGPALASGALDLPAPQAHAYAALLQATIGGRLPLALLALGAAFGAFVEWRSGFGTAFGLGMFLPLGIPGAFLLGAGLREAWERRWLAPRAAREGWDVGRRDLALADTYLLATGLMVGEALVGTAAALVLALGAL